MAPKKKTIRKTALTPTALVSGGAGFVGSHLVESFLNNNARVVVLDDYKTGKDIHIKHLLNNPNFAFYNVDINQGVPDEIESVDYVIHLAGLEEYLYSKEFVNLDTLLTNSTGTKNLLDLARVSNAKFLLASTLDVYQGRMSQLDLIKYFGNSGYDENKYSFAEAKRFAEAIVWEYFKKHDVDARIIRLPEVYGPRMNLDSSGFLGGFLKNIIEGNGITIYGDGFEKEYYLYISDVVSGMVKSLFSLGTKGNIYSLVPDSSISALELAYLVRKMADAEVSISFKPKVGDYPKFLKAPDTFNLKNIDWKSRIDLSSGITKTLESFGYRVNENSFKPAKFIQQKKETAAELTEKNNGELFSIAENFTAEKNNISVSNSASTEIGKPGITGKPDFNFPESYKSKPIKKPLFAFPKINLSFLKRKSNYGFSKSDFSQPIRPGKIFTGKSGLFLKIFSVIFSAVLIFLVVPSVKLYFMAKSGAVSLQKVSKSMASLDSDTVVLESAKAAGKFKSAQKSLATIRWAFTLAGKKEMAANGISILNSLVYFSGAVENIGSAIKPAEKLLETFRPDTQAVYDQSYIDQLQLVISNAQKFISQSQAEIKNVTPQNIPQKYLADYQSYQNIIEETQKSLLLISSLTTGIPEILGASGEKNYIVWFQNSNELRPTGGFIGSYGVLKVDQGKLKEVVIDDIYNPDGQIKLRSIITSPPQPIIDYLSEDRLYLRNSNWDPDFTKAAKEFDDLYFKVKGEKIDGYLAVDLSFVKNLLKVTGPIYLAAYNEEINSDNLYERTQYHSDFNYQDGSDQKRSFLTILGGKLMEKIFTLPKDKFSSLVLEMGNSLEQKHLLIYFMNNPFNALLKEKGWDGGLAETDKDYLYVINSNLGGTKANYFVKNKMTYEIVSMTRDGLLRANLYLDYTHTGKDSAWPGGPYKNYLRVLTQNGSKLTGAKIIRDGESEDIFKNVVISKEGLYNSYELGFTLEPSKNLRVVLNYDLPQNLTLTKEAVNYSLLWQKQPGTDGDQYAFIFNPPFGMTSKTYSSGLKLTDNILSSEGALNTNLNYFVVLQ